jgi:hypothetical protein
VRIHSRYQRTLADLPWNWVAVRLQLHVRKFYCDNAGCRRAIFTKPLPGLAAPRSGKTLRLTQVLSLLGYVLGGEAGARLAEELGLSVSPDVLLGRIRQETTPKESEIPVRVLGVDDFAFRKGVRYGTILVDLERRQVLDLLPDRTAQSLADWLKVHPSVETSAVIAPAPVPRPCVRRRPRPSRWPIFSVCSRTLMRCWSGWFVDTTNRCVR